MATNIGIYTTIKKAMREHGLQILNTDADVREHRFYRYRAIRLE